MPQMSPLSWTLLTLTLLVMMHILMKSLMNEQNTLTKTNHKSPSLNKKPWSW